MCPWQLYLTRSKASELKTCAQDSMLIVAYRCLQLHQQRRTTKFFGQEICKHFEHRQYRISVTNPKARGFDMLLEFTVKVRSMYIITTKDIKMTEGKQGICMKGNQWPNFVAGNLQMTCIIHL